jgi:hypothetical protein
MNIHFLRSISIPFIIIPLLGSPILHFHSVITFWLQVLLMMPMVMMIAKLSIDRGRQNLLGWMISLDFCKGFFWDLLPLFWSLFLISDFYAKLSRCMEEINDTTLLRKGNRASVANYRPTITLLMLCLMYVNFSFVIILPIILWPR